jgi:predicted  nucleic acid-binding Zn-ribbon protein
MVHPSVDQQKMRLLVSVHIATRSPGQYSLSFNALHARQGLVVTLPDLCSDP